MTKHVGRSDEMLKRAALVSLLVPDYDEALAFFVSIGLSCQEDTDLGNGKRWIRIAPPNGEIEFLLVRAAEDRLSTAVGEQGGGRVWLFLGSDDFSVDYARLKAAGVPFEGPPREEAYGCVVVWADPWGNRWELIQRSRTDHETSSLNRVLDLG